MHFAGLGAIGGIHDRALFHLGDLRRHADDDARMHQHLAVVRLLDEVVEHLLGDFEIGNDAIFHGLDGHDVAGRAAEHLFGLFTHGFHFAGDFVDGNDRRLVDHDAFALGIHQRVGGAQIDSQVAGKHAEQRAQVMEPGALRMESVG